jgi:hypothetical protein
MSTVLPVFHLTKVKQLQMCQKHYTTHNFFVTVIDSIQVKLNYLH